MSFGTLGEYRRRRKRAVYLRFLQIILLAASLFGTASYAYQVGVSASQTKADKLTATLDRFQSDNLRLRDDLAAEALQAERANRALAALEQRYRTEVPKGELQSLLQDLRQQIERGVEPDRLALLIEAAGHPPACTEAPDTKRFMPTTSVAGEVVNAVRFGEGRILVRGEGTSARNEQGLAEAWFDPAQPVRVTFTTLAGETQEVTGVLPLQHQMVVGGREHRFSIIAGQRAFIEITGQTCSLPGAAPGPHDADAHDPGDEPGADPAWTSG